MDRKMMMEKIRASRENWQAALASVPADRMEVPGVEGNWSVKDIICHVTWFEREMVNLLRTRALEQGSPLWLLPRDERNQAIYEAEKDRPLASALDEAGQVYQAFLRELKQVSEADLHDPNQFGMPPDWQPWQVLAENIWEHYDDHTRDLRSWLAQ